MPSARRQLHSAGLPPLLLRHFDQIAAAPDAIPRLRQFILDLAVRGRLVPQEPKDEPASELLARIYQALPGRKPTDPLRAIEIPINSLPFKVPTSWAWARLVGVAHVSYGFAFASSRFNSARTGMPLIRIRDIADTDTEAYFDGEFDAAYVVRNGDYLVGMDGDFNVSRWNGPDALLNQRVVRIKDWQGELVAAFLAIPLQMVLRHLHRLTSQTTVKHLSAKQVNGIYLPLPPLAEQHRIVAKVDELMALCDHLEAAQAERETRRTRLVASTHASLSLSTLDPRHSTFFINTLPRLTSRPDDIPQLRQIILTLAVRGKLATQNADDEPASSLRKRIQAEKGRRVKDGTLPSPKPSPVITEEETYFELPKAWQWVRMAEVTKLWNGYAFASGDFQAEGVPVIRIGDLQRGEVDPTGAVRVSEAVAKSVAPEFWITPDALLIAMSGATTGKVAFNRTGKRLLLNQRVGRLEVFLMSTGFIKLFLETIVARNLSISFGTAIPNLSTQQINETVLPLPPLAEQQRIVAKVDELMALCDRLEAQLTTSQTQSRRILESTLHQALAARSR